MWSPWVETLKHHSTLGKLYDFVTLLMLEFDFNQTFYFPYLTRRDLLRLTACLLCYQTADVMPPLSRHVMLIWCTFR